ncbi:MAG: PfkB family carbohydrate kinase [Firmicutes bacterium]|nr:PfkB family carbohydrate kinase [Bacillota bacterium]
MDKKIFDNYKNLSIGVFGDYCLDEYLWIDSALNEPSLETDLVAYQCVKRETSPGAAGTIAKNLANLGVGTIYAIGFAGDDGRGLELCRGLDRLDINRENLILTDARITSTHTKPWITNPDSSKYELNRIDIKNWTTTPTELEDAVFKKLEQLIPKLDALIILDHIVEENCGIITDNIRRALAALAKENPNLLIYADSRCRIGQFENMMIKGNQFELTHAVYGMAETDSDAPVKLAADPSVIRTEEEISQACEILRHKNNQPVICTLGEHGVRIYSKDTPINIPGIPVQGQTDVCGAGDMFTSAFISAVAAGADIEYAAKIGNIAAAICVTQLGTSGHVTQSDILERL